METKLKAKEILDYCLSALGINVNDNAFLGLKKQTYKNMLKEITFMIDND